MHSHYPTVLCLPRHDQLTHVPGSHSHRHTVRTIELRDAADVDDAVQSALNPNAGSPAPGAGGSSAANLSHGKPVRPGRGKVKVSKFKLDEEA